MRRKKPERLNWGIPVTLRGPLITGTIRYWRVDEQLWLLAGYPAVNAGEMAIPFDPKSRYYSRQVHHELS